jgi:hypothetical protein
MCYLSVNDFKLSSHYTQNIKISYISSCPPLEGDYNPKLKEAVRRMLIEETDFRLSIENIYSFSFIQNVFNSKISS